MRALRVDKMTYAALEATLAEYVAGRARTTVPVQRMLTMTADEIRARADALADAIRGNRRLARRRGRRALRPSAAAARLAWSCRRGSSRSRRTALTPDALEARAAPPDAAGHRAHRARPRCCWISEPCLLTRIPAAALIATRMAESPEWDPIIGRMIRPFSGWCLAALLCVPASRGGAAAIARRGHVERRRRRTAHLRRAMRLVPRRRRHRRNRTRSPPHNAASRGQRSRTDRRSCGTAFRGRRCRGSPAR